MSAYLRALENFELLDVAAPCELLGASAKTFKLIYASPVEKVVTSSCMGVSTGQPGPQIVPTHKLVFGDVDGVDSAALEALAYDERGTLFVPDIVLVPGGLGVRTEVKGGVVLRWLKRASKQSKPRIIFSVCTGSWLLAAAGALNGRRATSNKRAMAQGHPQTAGPAVFWQPRARWVFDEDESGKLFLTSSGVAAGGDAALALIARLAGDVEAERIAMAAEWSWHRDADADPFATE